MKLLNKLIIILLLSTSINYAQEFNGYKYFVIGDIDYGAKGKDIYGIRNSMVQYLSKLNNNIILGFNNPLRPSELKYNSCLGLYVSISHKDRDITIKFKNCKKEIIKLVEGSGRNSFDRALKQIFDQLDENPYYSFDESLTPNIIYPEVENINKDENELKAYFDSTKSDPIEGIYKSYKYDTTYKMGIIKVGDKYKALIIESDYPHWKKGDVKAIFESTAAEGVFSTKFYTANKTPIETFSNLEGGLINIEIKNSNGENEDMKLLKLYPKN